MELIDRETLLQKLHDELFRFNDWEGEDEYMGIMTGLGKAIDIATEEPKVDAVQVVRCKDCEYFWNTEKYGKQCTLYGQKVQENTFCAWAERKEEDGTR